jgi:hypothetical protein
MRQLGERISLDASYGHMFMDGRIVDNPDEQRFIRKIYDFPFQGDSHRNRGVQGAGQGPQETGSR